MNKIVLCIVFCTSCSWVTAQKTAGEWYFKANSLREQKVFDEAITAYNQAIYLSPQFAGAFNNRGAIKVELGYFQEAIEDLTKSIDYGHPIPAIPYYNRGNAYEKMGNCCEAVRNYLEALKLNPTYEEAKEGMKRLEKCRA